MDERHFGILDGVGDRRDELNRGEEVEFVF